MAREYGVILGSIGSVVNFYLFLFFLAFRIIFGVVLDIVVLLSGGFFSLEEYLSTIDLINFWLILLCIWFLFFCLLGGLFSFFMSRDELLKKGGIGVIVIGMFSFNLFLIIGGIVTLFSKTQRESAITLLSNKESGTLKGDSSKIKALNSQRFVGEEYS